MRFIAEMMLVQGSEVLIKISVIEVSALAQMCLQTEVP